MNYKDPPRFPVIREYEDKIQKDFSAVTKLMTKDIQKFLRNGFNKKGDSKKK